MNFRRTDRAWASSKRLLLGISWGVFVVAALSVTRLTHKSNLEQWFLGHLFTFRGARTPSPEIVLISIGDADFEALGSWQWPRSYHSIMLEILKETGVKTVAYDILFLDPNVSDPNGDRQLVSTLSWMDNVVVPIIVEHSGQSAPVATYPFPDIRDVAPLMGYVNVLPAKDKAGVSIDLQRGAFSYFGLQVLAHYLTASPEHLQTGNGWMTVQGRGGGRYLPVDQDGAVFINYTGPTNAWKWYSFSEVLRAYKKSKEYGVPDVPLHDFRNKIVLIGTTGTSTADVYSQPFGTSYGLEVHANFLNNALQGNFLVKPPKLVRLLTAYGLIVVFSAFLLLARLRYGIVAAVLTLAAIVAASYGLFVHANWWIDAIQLSLSVVLTIIPIYGTKFVVEERRRRYIRNAFCLYLSPKVVKDIEKHPEKLHLGGERKILTVMFTDLAGFSTISETMNPHALVTLLNEYLSEMTDTVLRNDGTVDKYEGDAIIAFFGAPVSCDNHHLQACRTALAMQRRLSELVLAWQAEGYPKLSMRIGINTGEMIVGNLGSRQRMDYTVIGDAVNLASRLEGVNKVYGTGILASQDTYEKVAGEILCREIDCIRVVGKNTPVTIYEVVGFIGDAVAQPLQAAILHYREGLASYRRGDWEQAIDAFKRVLEVAAQDTPARVLMNRCIEYSRNPPGAPWDGVYDMPSK